MDLSIVMPAYLEEENLRLLLPRINKVAGSLTPQFEVIVVDTCEPMDGTPAACKDFDVRYVSRRGGNTYGAAVRTGIEEANGERILFMDSDGSHHPDFIGSLWGSRQEQDIVIASRYTTGGQTENNLILIAMSRIVNWGYSFVLGIRCKDVSNSFKLYDAKLLKSLYLSCENFDIVEEIFFKLTRAKTNLKFVELPFCFKKRMFGETKRNLVSFIFTYIFTLIKLRLMGLQRRP